jgi:hypothetical protein
MNVEIGTEATQFRGKEYINRTLNGAFVAVHQQCSSQDDYELLYTYILINS